MLILQIAAGVALAPIIAVIAVLAVGTAMAALRALRSAAGFIALTAALDFGFLAVIFGLGLALQ